MRRTRGIPKALVELPARVAAAAIAAWQGASAKTAFRERAEKLRRAAGQARHRDDAPEAS